MEQLILCRSDRSEERFHLLLQLASKASPLRACDFPNDDEIVTLVDLLAIKPYPLVPDMPLALHSRGTLLSTGTGQPSVAIIGSRHPTLEGRSHARLYARHLAECGITVWSGGAIGIDTEALAGALDTQSKAGVVLGSGLECLYPASNIHLFSNSNLTLVSEFSSRHPPRPWTFPIRNFTLAWLTDYTLVIESQAQSGSHITAEWASCLGRGLGALCWPDSHRGSFGNQRLHEIGAHCIRRPEDVINYIRCLTSSPTERISHDLAAKA